MATVDILMATYNGERYVREQIESIQAQTFEDWRLLVSDDCSTDGTFAVVEDMASKDSRIMVLPSKMSFGSAKANFIHLLSMVDAPYAMFCDQDDVWLPEKIERQVAAIIELEKNEGSDLPLAVFSDSIVTDSLLNVTEDSFLAMNTVMPFQARLENQLVENAVPGNCLLINGALATIMSSLPNCEHIVMHDWATLIVALALGKVCAIEKGLLLYRQHSNNAAGVANRKRFSFLLGKMLGRPRSSFRASSDQARVIVDWLGDSLPSRSIEPMRAWGEIYSHSKLERLAICRRYGLWKRGRAKKLYQIAFI